LTDKMPGCERCDQDIPHAIVEIYINDKGAQVEAHGNGIDKTQLLGLLQTIAVKLSLDKLGERVEGSTGPITFEKFLDNFGK